MLKGRTGQRIKPKERRKGSREKTGGEDSQVAEMWGSLMDIQYYFSLEKVETTRQRPGKLRPEVRGSFP